MHHNSALGFLYQSSFGLQSNLSPLAQTHRRPKLPPWTASNVVVTQHDCFFAEFAKKKTNCKTIDWSAEQELSRNYLDAWSAKIRGVRRPPHGPWMASRYVGGASLSSSPWPWKKSSHFFDATVTPRSPQSRAPTSWSQAQEEANFWGCEEFLPEFPPNWPEKYCATFAYKFSPFLPGFSGILPGFPTNQNFWGCACTPCTPTPPPTPLQLIFLGGGCKLM